MNKKQLAETRAPFFELLQAYQRQPRAPFHTPGHKAGRILAADWPEAAAVLKYDLTELAGLPWRQAWADAEELAARFYQAEQSFFLVQGASQGIAAALLGAFAPGQRVLVARDCHQSVSHGLVLADLEPVYLETTLLPEWGIAAGVKPEIVAQALQDHPDCQGLILTNPSYQGVASTLAPYRELIGERILIVDEAHGGHLGWSGLTGYDASLLADLWVQGTHKLLGSLTQSGLLHRRGRRVDPARLQQALELISTTSPSFLLLSGLDLNRRFLALKGRRLFRERLDLIQQLRESLAGLPGIAVLSNSDLSDPGQIIDPWKLCLSFRELGLTGSIAAERLRREFLIEPEYADAWQVTLFSAPWQDPRDWERLRTAVASSSQRGGRPLASKITSVTIPPLALRPRAAALGRQCLVPLKQASGRIAAAVVAPYPPGIPVLAPGELIGPDQVDAIELALTAGGLVRGITPPGEVLVVDE